jgi:5-carboxymethyl-2-hydroxymuconic-semialdehyde dehydrogenase
MMMGEAVTEPQPTDKPGLELPRDIEHFIGGRHVPSVRGGTFGVADPVSNQVYARAAAGDADDVEAAAEAATEAFARGPCR